MYSAYCSSGRFSSLWPCYCSRPFLEFLAHLGSVDARISKYSPLMPSAKMAPQSSADATSRLVRALGGKHASTMPMGRRCHVRALRGRTSSSPCVRGTDASTTVILCDFLCFERKSVILSTSPDYHLFLVDVVREGAEIFAVFTDVFVPGQSPPGAIEVISRRGETKRHIVELERHWYVLKGANDLYG